MANIARELKECQERCAKLKESLEEARKDTNPSILKQISEHSVSIRDDYEPHSRNECTGHFGKIYALHWGHDSDYIVTASQDGKLIIWASHSGNKQLAITLNSAWVMTCAFSKSYDHIASGGLDNTVSIFRVRGKGNDEGDGKFKTKDLYRELEKHDGYLSCARFLGKTEILSASGDGSCILWDIESRSTKNIYQDHSGDVMSIAINKKNPKLFVSGSVDTTAKIWDLKASEKCIANFTGHEQDINTVEWFPDHDAFITGSDDGTVRMFDMRCMRQLMQYNCNDNNGNNNNMNMQSDIAGVTSVDVNKSGSYIFAAYGNGGVYCWNALNGEQVCDLTHSQRVSALAVSPDGYALATGCWDFNLRVYA